MHLFASPLQSPARLASAKSKDVAAILAVCDAKKHAKQMVMEKHGSVDVPLPTSDQTVDLHTCLRSTNMPLSILSRVTPQRRRSVLQNLPQRGATLLGFSTVYHLRGACTLLRSMSYPKEMQASGLTEDRETWDAATNWCARPRAWSQPLCRKKLHQGKRLACSSAGCLSRPGCSRKQLQGPAHLDAPGTGDGQRSRGNGGDVHSSRAVSISCPPSKKPEASTNVVEVEAVWTGPVPFQGHGSSQVGTPAPFSLTGKPDHAGGLGLQGSIC